MVDDTVVTDDATPEELDELAETLALLSDSEIIARAIRHGDGLQVTAGDLV